MKKSTAFIAFAFLASMLIYSGLQAQDFVVDVKGDTVKGSVKPQITGATSKVIVTDANKKKTSYSLFQVKSFYFKNSEYRPVKGPNGYCFMKLQKAGYLSLYSFQLPNQNTFDGYYLAKMDGSGIEVPNLAFKKTLINFLKECSDVTGKIDKGDLGKRQLNEIIDAFNSCIASKSINHAQLIVQKEVQAKKMTAWDLLEEKLKGQSEFDGKANAMEMVIEIKAKLSRSEKVPNFLIDGLKGIINPTELKVDLENALKELN